MQTRFFCAACKSHHVLDMPETTIFMTCGKTGRQLQLDLGVGGEPVVTLLGEDGRPEEADGESNESAA